MAITLHICRTKGRNCLPIVRKIGAIIPRFGSRHLAKETHPKEIYGVGGGLALLTAAATTLYSTDSNKAVYVVSTLFFLPGKTAIP